MTYNASNLFDDQVDGTEYSPYGNGPSGVWTTARFKAKLAAVARVIKSAFPGGPDVVALQEVENLNTLNQLCERHLQGLHYNYRFMYPLAHSAHQCALLSRYPFKSTGALLPGEWHGESLRAILEAELSIRGETLHLFVNHWKAKSEGDAVTEAGRLRSAEKLISRLKSILQTNPLADIVVLGDFNEDLDEFIKAKGKYQTAFIPAANELPLPAAAGVISASSLFLTADAAGLEAHAPGAVCLYDPWYETTGPARGSYVFRGQWLTPDHILITRGLFDEAGLYYRPSQFNTLRPEFLLDPRTGFPLKPGLQTNPFSDHLPLLLTLAISPPAR
jgi:endonuclease/exonuclease/phosphatase family metal-dependent hydrolase